MVAIERLRTRPANLRAQDVLVDLLSSETEATRLSAALALVKIGAQTVVKGDIPPYSVAVGAPARVIKRREKRRSQREGETGES